MRFSRLLSAVLTLTMGLSVVADDQRALANTEILEDDAAAAKEKADAASGLVDEAIEDRDRIERQLMDSIAHADDLSDELSILGVSLDRTAEQIGFADVELAVIQDQIEVQAVDAYMTVLASPTISLVRSETVEQALVASSVVEEVISAGRATVDQLIAKRSTLQELQALFLTTQDEYVSLQEALQAEIDHLAALYEEADASVAAAIVAGQQADAEYRAALSAVDLSRARDAERRRQEHRASPTVTTTTTSTTTATTTTTSAPGTTTTTAAATTTSPPGTTTTTTSGGGGPWVHPPEVERWRPLVQSFFPSSRVEEALRIIDCESNGDPDAYNPYSGASGLFQFIPSTWATTAPKAGYAGYSVFDPEANVASAAWLANRYAELGQDYWRAWSCRRVLT